MSMLVRIKPLNPKRGQHARTVIILGTKFVVERGWYEVDDDFAAVLKEERLGGDPEASLVFDVCTKEEALAMQRAEDRQKTEAARAERPIAPERVSRREKPSASKVAAFDEPDADDGKVTTNDLARKSATPIAADGADDEDEPEEETEGRVAEVGRMVDDAAPAPKGKTRSRKS